LKGRKTHARLRAVARLADRHDRRDAGRVEATECQVSDVGGRAHRAIEAKDRVGPDRTLRGSAAASVHRGDGEERRVSCPVERNRPGRVPKDRLVRTVLTSGACVRNRVPSVARVVSVLDGDLPHLKLVHAFYAGNGCFRDTRGGYCKNRRHQK